MTEQKYELVITADTNDADYISETSVVTLEQIIELNPIIDAIRDHGGHNWPSSEYADESPNEIYSGILTDDQIDLFSELIPYGEYGIHTIESIEYYPLPNKVRLL